MQATLRPLRVGVYGAGNWARKTHLPNLSRLPGVELAAVCDVDAGRAAATAAQFGIPHTYTEGHRMLADERLDILFSVVPAYARTDVEAVAAARGIHLFSEKPQALDMATARRIDAAVRQGGVFSTVCFRERYRPLFQQARRLLAGKQIVHVRFHSPRGLPALLADVPPEQRRSWHFDMARAGGPAFDWGVHAVDYTRFITGLDFSAVQAFYHHPPEYNTPLSCSFNLRFQTGATMTVNFTAAGARVPAGEAPFTVYYAGGFLALFMYDRLEVDNEVVYRAADFDPWFEQDRVFVEAVRSGDGSGICNDYHDGLSSLAPVLAGWESARTGGELIDVAAFAAA
jgi:predicted dehydrogenase